MKKLLYLLTAGSLVLSLTGCSGRKTGDEISETVNSFFETLESGDYIAASEYLSGQAKEEFSTLTSQYGSFEDYFDGLNLNEETKEKTDALMKTIMGKVFRNHQVSPPEKGENNIYTVKITAEILDSSSVEASSILNSMDVNTLISDEAYEKAMEINKNESQEAAANFLIGIILDQISVMYEDILKTASYSSVSRTFTVEKTDGEWKITSLNQEQTQKTES